MVALIGAAAALGLQSAQAAPVVNEGGVPTVVRPAGGANAGQPLTTGDSDTDFTLKLPDGASCGGDGVAGFRVHSFMINASADPGALTFGQIGPTPRSVGATFRDSLYKTDGEPWANQAPNAASTPGGPGAIINIGPFDYFNAGYASGDIPPGDYKLGIACTRPTGQPEPLEKYWVLTFAFAANPTDPGDAKIRWTAQAASPTTTTTTGPTTTTTAGGGSGTTTSTTAAGGTTTTTLGGSSATTSTSTVAGSGTTNTTRNTTGSTASVGSGGLARSGTSAALSIFVALVLLMLGRAFVLSVRPNSVRGSHYQ